MKNLKIIFPILLLTALVLAGASCGQSPKSFYKKYCKIYVNDYQPALIKYYDMDEKDIDEHGGEAYGFYKDVDKCVEKNIELEEEMYKQCVKTEDEEKCNEGVDKWREFLSESMTKDGCSENGENFMCAYYKDSPELKKQYNDCMDEVEELCKDLPKNF